MLGLGCWVGFSLVVVSESYFLFVVCGLLIAVASSCEATTLGLMGFRSWGPQALGHKLSSWGTWAWLLHGMWDLPRPGIKPISSALTGDSFPLNHQGSPGFLTEEGGGRPVTGFSTNQCCLWDYWQRWKFREVQADPGDTAVQFQTIAVKRTL